MNVMKKIIFVALAVILLAVGIGYYRFGIDWDAQPFVLPKGTVLLRISPETTVVTEPLLPGGNAIDFFALLDQKCSAGADSEENGFPVGNDSPTPLVTNKKQTLLQCR